MFDMNSSQNITKIGRLIRDDQAAAIRHLKLEGNFLRTFRIQETF